MASVGTTKHLGPGTALCPSQPLSLDNAPAFFPSAAAAVSAVWATGVSAAAAAAGQSGVSTAAPAAAATPPRPVEPAVRFRDWHGRNIALSNKGCVARRVASYNQGLVLAAQPLRAGQLFEVRDGER